jgi:Bacterial Ig-like domain (group 3)
MVLALPCARGVAQNTTVSGTVYDPRTTNALPLPNVLVYASTTPVNPVNVPATGRQCLPVQTPAGSNVVAFTYTAVDGTFTLPNIPENGSYTIVIQAGKWQRQFSETVGAGPLSGLVLNMPANHTQGSMPMIAIATGAVDGAECVLRDMGISDSEFTDDTQTTNPGGYIHLYQGSAASGAEISASTPSETLLMNGTSVTPLDSYDMVMFPCQGGASGQATSTGANNLLEFANAGGRIFATHYSYAWLDPDSPYDAQFGSVANWTISPEQQITSGVGTVLTNFSDGATLAQWLENSAATLTGTSNQIEISTLRTDVGSVIAPTQSRLTYNGLGNPVMQMTFNTPVGNPAASQCGRVMFNDYHVISVSSSGKVYPTECPSYNNPSYTMSAQEKMLEYALFDLSSFVQPVVTPTVNVTFNPSPVLVKEGDTADQVVVSVINTSSTTQIGSSAILSFALPQLLTVTAMTDSTGGWICNVATVTCTRNSSLAASATDPVTLTFGVSAYPAGGLSSYTGVLTATVSSVTFSTNPSFTDNVIYQQPPLITWPTPAPIIYGTALSSTQLDASTTIAGTFTYSPSAGTVLAVGQQTLSAVFTPTDTTDYTSENASVTLTVLPGTATVNLTSSAGDAFLTSAVTFTATVPSPGNSQTGTMTFYDGASVIGSSSLSGASASITVSNLPAGTQSVTAVYSGDSDYGSATSNVLPETIQDFTLTAAGGGTASVLPATQASFTLIVTPVGGSTLPGALNMSVTGLPVGVTASFNPATVTANSPATDVILQVQLAGSAAQHGPASPFGRDALPLTLGLILLPFSLRRRGRAGLRKLLLLAAMAVALGASFTGCGGGSLANQSFSFPVTAQSGGLSHTVTVQLTVESSQH